MGEKFYNLVRHYGQEHDIVIFRRDDELFICNPNTQQNDDGTYPLPLHAYIENLEETIQFFHDKGDSVRFVEYIDQNGKFAIPNLDELQEYEDADY